MIHNARSRRAALEVVCLGAPVRARFGGAAIVVFRWMRRRPWDRSLQSYLRHLTMPLTILALTPLVWSLAAFQINVTCSPAQIPFYPLEVACGVAVAWFPGPLGADLPRRWRREARWRISWAPSIATPTARFGSVIFAVMGRTPRRTGCASARWRPLVCAPLVSGDSIER